VPKAPRTWDELISFAKAAHDKNPKVDGYLYNGGRYEGTFFDNLGYFWMQGGKLLDGSGRPVFAEGKDRAAMLKMLSFLRKTVTSGASPASATTLKSSCSSRSSRRPLRTIVWSSTSRIRIDTGEPALAGSASRRSSSSI